MGMQARHEEAEGLLRAFEPALLRLALLLTGDRQDARDLTQETLTRAWSSRRRWTKVEQPRAYVRAILVNEARRSARGRRPHERLTEVSAGSTPDETDRHAERDAVGRALRALPVGQRTAVVLRHYEQLSESEVAALMKCSVGNVKSQTSRGLASLRRILHEHEETLP